MTAFTVLSITIAIAIVAVTCVVAVRLWRAAQTMADSVRASAGRIGPLAEELQDELAVTQTELDHLQARSARLRADRTPSTE